MVQKFTIGKLVPRCCNRNGKVMTAERKGGDQSRPSKILLVYSDLKVNSKSSHFLKAFGLITRHPWLKGPLSATPLVLFTCQKCGHYILRRTCRNERDHCETAHCN